MKADGLVYKKHEWKMPTELIPWEFCGVCGIIKRTDGGNSPACPGPPGLRPFGKVRRMTKDLLDEQLNDPICESRRVVDELP